MHRTGVLSETVSESHYHLELRAFPHVARVFNLDRGTLDARYLKPWSEGDAIECDDRRWAAEKTKLTVLLGPELSTAERGLGRGWGEATRQSHDVTESVLAEVHRGAEARPEVETLKEALREVAAGGVLRFPDAVALAAVAHPAWRASEQLALAEQAVWEMLHRATLELRDEDLAPVPRERWQEIVLSFPTWTDHPATGLRLRSR